MLQNNYETKDEREISCRAYYMIKSLGEIETIL